MISQNIRDLVRRLSGEGDSYRNIAKIVGIAPNTARNIVLKLNKKVKDKTGPKRKLSKTNIMNIKRSVSSLTQEGQQVTTREVMKQCDLNHVSRWTVSRALSSVNYKYKTACQDIVLTKDHKQRRLELARIWLDKMHPWSKVVWTDEKRFNLDGPDSWASWIREGQKVLRNKRQQGGRTIQYWGMILPDGRLVLKELSQWSKSEDYINHLQNFVHPLLELELGEDYIFQQDNASIHVSKKTMEYFRQEQIQLMDWPARSPDLSPIENVWSLLSQQVYKGPQYQNVNDLRESIEQAVRYLNNNERQKILNIRNSIQTRLRKVIETKGDKIPY